MRLCVQKWRLTRPKQKVVVISSWNKRAYLKRFIELQIRLIVNYSPIIWRRRRPKSRLSRWLCRRDCSGYVILVRLKAFARRLLLTKSTLAQFCRCKPRVYADMKKITVVTASYNAMKNSLGRYNQIAIALYCTHTAARERSGKQSAAPTKNRRSGSHVNWAKRSRRLVMTVMRIHIKICPWQLKNICCHYVFPLNRKVNLDLYLKTDRPSPCPHKCNHHIANIFSTIVRLIEYNINQSIKSIKSHFYSANMS